MVTSLPALACLALALAAAVAPTTAGAARLARLGRPGTSQRPRHLPGGAVTSLGLMAGLVVLGPAGGLAGGVAATAWHRRHGRRRVADVATATTSELAAALGRITDELRAGAHPAAALNGTAADGPLARAVLAPAARAAALGDGVPAALDAAAVRHPGVAPELRRVARTWALAERHGVPAAEPLASVLADIRWRVAHAHRVRAQLAGPRATAVVLTVLPGLGLALGELVGAAPLAVLRSGVLGQLLVVVGAALAAAGATWTGYILQTAVPR